MDESTSFSWESEIRRHRDIILNHLLMAGTFGGGIGLLLLFVPKIVNPLERLAGVSPFLVLWLVVLGVWLLRGRLNYRIRTWTVLLIIYFMGCYLLLDGGLTGSGRIWLLLGPLLAVVMLDVWPGGVLSGALSILIYVFFALDIGLGGAPRNSGVSTDLGYWITEGGDFLIAVAGLVLGMWGFRRGWLEALQGTGAANERLEDALRDLQILNAELDMRVNERTRQLSERTQELSDSLARERSEANKNQAILEGIADGVIVFDRMGRVITANPAMGTLLGRPADSIMGQTFETLTGQDIPDDDREMISRLLQDGGITWSGFKFRWGDKTFAVSIAPVHSDIDLAGMVAVFHDFTQEAEIDRMRSSFLEIASHDLRSPLGAILGLTELLQVSGKGALSAEQERLLERIASNARYMASLVSSLLGQAQIEAGVFELNISSFSPAEIAERVICGLEALAQSKELALRLEIADGVPNVVWNDEQKVSQILMNLVGNAIRFTAVGWVEVRAYMVDRDRWVLEVADTGPGIPAGMQERVFDRYQRGDRMAPDISGGVGLGLSIVKKLVGVMGGEIKLKSEVGKGSTFTVALPLLGRDGTPAS
jgi:PAS domain S-box-containing protein